MISYLVSVFTTIVNLINVILHLGDLEDTLADMAANL